WWKGRRYRRCRRRWCRSRISDHPGTRRSHAAEWIGICHPNELASFSLVLTVRKNLAKYREVYRSLEKSKVEENSPIPTSQTSLDFPRPHQTSLDFSRLS